MQHYRDGLAIAICAAIGAILGTHLNLLCQCLSISTAAGILLDAILRTFHPRTK